DPAYLLSAGDRPHRRKDRDERGTRRQRPRAPLPGPDDPRLPGRDAARMPPRGSPRVGLAHPVTERDAFLARHLAVAVGARRLDALERAHEDDATPAGLATGGGPGPPVARG